MKSWKLVLLPILSLVIVFMLEGVITAYFNATLFTSIGYVAPRITVIFLVMFAFYLSPNHVYILSLIIGFLYDSYYTGYLGIYMASFCLISYLVIRLRDMFKPNVLTHGLVSILMITLLEVMGYWIFRILGITDIGVSLFLAERLGATLLFNGIFLFALNPLLEKFLLFILNDNLYNYSKL